MAKASEVKIESDAKPQRQQRVPVSGPRDILTVIKRDDNYVYRWVIDKPGRIQRFLDGGYEIVNHETEVGQPTVDRGSRLGSAMTYSTGGQTLVLMRQRREWYNEDQDAKQRDLDALEAVLFNEGLKVVKRELGGTTPNEKEEFYKR